MHCLDCNVGMTSDGIDVVKIIFYLIAVIALLIALSVFVKKYVQDKLPFENALIKIIAIRSLSKNHKLALIELSGKRILIGFTDHYISKLESLDTTPPSQFQAELSNYTDTKSNEAVINTSNKLDELKKKIQSW